MSAIASHLDVTLSAFLSGMFGGTLLPLESIEIPAGFLGQQELYLEERVELQSERLLGLSAEDLVWALEWYFGEIETVFADAEVSAQGIVFGQVYLDPFRPLDLTAQITCDSIFSIPVLHVRIMAQVD